MSGRDARRGICGGTTNDVRGDGVRAIRSSQVKTVHADFIRHHGNRGLTRRVRVFARPVSSAHRNDCRLRQGRPEQHLLHRPGERPSMWRTGNPTSRCNRSDHLGPDLGSDGNDHPRYGRGVQPHRTRHQPAESPRMPAVGGSFGHQRHRRTGWRVHRHVLEPSPLPRRGYHSDSGRDHHLLLGMRSGWLDGSGRPEIVSRLPATWHSAEPPGGLLPCGPHRVGSGVASCEYRGDLDPSQVVRRRSGR